MAGERGAQPPSLRGAETAQETIAPLFPPLLRTQRAGTGATVTEGDRKQHTGPTAFSRFLLEEMELTQIF